MAGTRNDAGIENVEAVDQMVRNHPAMGKCQWRVKSAWQRGTKCQVSVAAWTAGGQPMNAPPRKFVLMVDEPEMEAGLDAHGMLGHDKGVRNGVTGIRYAVPGSRWR